MLNKIILLLLLIGTKPIFCHDLNLIWFEATYNKTETQPPTYNFKECQNQNEESDCRALGPYKFYSPEKIFYQNMGISFLGGTADLLGMFGVGVGVLLSFASPFLPSPQEVLINKVLLSSAASLIGSICILHFGWRINRYNYGLIKKKHDAGIVYSIERVMELAYSNYNGLKSFGAWVKREDIKIIENRLYEIMACQELYECPNTSFIDHSRPYGFGLGISNIKRKQS